MTHIALYRSWRPQAFSDMVGQQHITQTLQNALREKRFAHAYLFSGPRGTGKTSAAKILAKAVNCDQGVSVEPCNECDACRRITDGAVMDVIEIDAASNRGVEEIRDIRDKVKYAPTEVRWKVYIIDEVHMLTTEAFNALLKTLEEPPEHVMFILATTEPHRLPATIISRCQRFDFRRVSMDEQVERLKAVCERANVTAEETALYLIARLSDGGMRDAISLLDQAISFADGHITSEQVNQITGGVSNEHFAELIQAIHRQDIGETLEIIHELIQSGKNADKCMEGLILFCRDVLLVQTVPESRMVTERLHDQSLYLELSKLYNSDELFYIIELLSRYHGEMKYASQPQTILEVAMMKVCAREQANNSAEDQIPSSQLNELTNKINNLERELAELKTNGIAAVSSNASSPARTSGEGRASRSSRNSGSNHFNPAQYTAFLQQANREKLKQVTAKWAEILQLIRDRKVTVHAWLIDGEVVACTNNEVLIAFKNSIHRETTERDSNKSLIEAVLAERIGESMRVVTIMRNEWESMEASSLSSSAEAENENGDESASSDATEDVLQAEDMGDNEPIQSQSSQHAVQESPKSSKHKEPWINEAIELFGEDLVVIKDD